MARSAPIVKSRTSGMLSYAFLALIAAMFLVNLYLIFAYVPTERVMGIIQRIFYFHVPTALVGFIAFAVAAFGSIAYLLGRKGVWDRVAHASVEAGTVYFTVAIITGAVWAQPVWGTWWVWDANGTLSFVLWILFLGYLAVRAYAPTPDMARRWAAVVSLMGLALVPFVYMAANWWSGLHPDLVAGPLAEDDALETAMSRVLTFSLVTFTLLFVYMVKERVKQRGLEETLEEVRQRAG